jgi:outer membrane protein assembly factor BamD (BamD/ComL family)
MGPRPVAPSSRREISQLVRIRALLEEDPAAAYRLAQRSEREFPHGVLSEERRALQVLALAKSGATEAADRKAREFFARYPQSPLRELVEAALKR